MKKNLFLSLVLLVILSSCARKTTLDIKMYGAQDSTAIVVSKLAVSKLSAIDTLYLENGQAEIVLEIPESFPEFVYLSTENGSMVPLLVSNGEEVVVEMNSIGEAINVQGSEESLLLQSVEAEKRSFSIAFDSLTMIANNAAQSGDEITRERVNKELGALYVAHKQKSIRYIYANPKSMTVIPVIFQNVVEGLPLFSEYTDAILFERVYDSLSSIYSGSPYLVSLISEAQRRKNLLQMENLLSEAQRTDFPDIILPDFNAQQKKLSDLQGNVILLYFWDHENDGMKLYNTDLIPIYNKYHSKGFEIYQVAITENKTDWAIYLKGQPLPWINVCDVAGDLSYAAAIYNVTELPSCFLISKDGTIVSRNIFDINMLEKEIAKLISAK